MKDRISILFLSVLLLMAVSYVQVFQKFIDDHRFSVEVIHDANEGTEEGAEKTGEENARETDQDEDPFRLAEMMMFASGNPVSNSAIGNYSFGQLGFYPEIVSPPPQT